MTRNRDGASKWPGRTPKRSGWRGIHEPVTLSQGRFGPVEALPRILALLEKAEVRASFSMAFLGYFISLIGLGPSTAEPRFTPTPRAPGATTGFAR